MRTLTQTEREEICKKLVKNGVPVRFQEDGQTVDIVTGEKNSKGCNIMYQRVYWNFTRETAKEVATLTGTKPVFSE